MLPLDSEEDLEHGVHGVYLGNHTGTYQDVRHVQKRTTLLQITSVFVKEVTRWWKWNTLQTAGQHFTQKK